MQFNFIPESVDLKIAESISDTIGLDVSTSGNTDDVSITIAESIPETVALDLTQEAL